MTTDFARNYSPPGVYIEENETSLVATGGIPPTLVGIAGPARGYQTYTEQIALTEDPEVRLAKQGIVLDSIVLTVVATGATVEETDYTATPSVAVTSANDHYVDIVRANDAEVDDGTAVFVAYQYTVPDYFDPKRFSNYEDVKDIYGEPLNLAVLTPGDTSYEYVTSPLSLAAKIAFDNGASEVYLVAATPPGSGAVTDAQKSTARQAALAAAYAKTATIPQIDLMVGITHGIATADANLALTDLRGHLTDCIENGVMRFGITGFDPAVTTAPDSMIAAANAEDRRLMLAYAGPSGLLMYSGSANSTFPVGHSYLAAAYAGRMAALPVQQAITKQTIVSFSGLAGTPMSNSLKNQYAAAGVALVEVDRLGRLVVRHGVTTDTTNVNTKEASVVRAKDKMVTLLQEGSAESDLIGLPLDEVTLLSVKSTVQGMLEFVVSEGVIVSYNGLAIRQISADPSVVEVKFAYRPAYPLNYIVISFSIDMSTGETTLTETV